MDIFEELLDLGLQHFFHAKLSPSTAKTVFGNPKGPLIDFKKFFIQHPKGGPFGFANMLFAVPGVYF